jgi:hypothetical protein
VYGFLITVVGFALLVWLPATDHLRLLIGGAVVLLGGVMVNAQAVKEWVSIVLPFIGKKGSDK